MIHRWPDERKILAEGVGPSRDYDYVVVDSKQPALCGEGWCDCRTQILSEDVEPQLIVQEHCFASEPGVTNVWDCQKEVISRENCKMEEQQIRVFPDGSTYTGDWTEDERTGHGVQVWQDGACYEGEWLRGNAHGHGRFLHPNGDVYEGSWMLDRAHGFGSYTHKDGSMYQGNWSQDLQDGSGVETWEDGGRYEGDYQGGMKHGVGKLSWSDGSIYQGQFQKNSIQGNGIYSWADGRRYVGQWKNNRMHGRGQFSWADGRSYAGEYADDVKDGIGMFQSVDGRIFAGRWSNGDLAVGGKDIAVEADEREPHPDDRVNHSHLPGINGHVPASNDVQQPDTALSPRRESCGLEGSSSVEATQDDDVENNRTLPAATLLELTESIRRLSPGKKGNMSEVIQTDSPALSSGASVLHGRSLGDFPEQKSLYSLANTVHEAWDKLNETAKLRDEEKAVVQRHDAKNRCNNCDVHPRPTGGPGAAAGNPPWVNSDS